MPEKIFKLLSVDPVPREVTGEIFMQFWKQFFVSGVGRVAFSSWILVTEINKLSKIDVNGGGARAAKGGARAAKGGGARPMRPPPVHAPDCPPQFFF